MKKILLSLILVTAFMLQKSEAQVSIGFSVNIGNQPEWGPAGYDNAQFYYFPDEDVYYDVADREFVYFDNGQWVYSYNLPSFCADFDLYNAYKVVINEQRPFLHADFYRREYSKYRGYHGQQVIRDRNRIEHGNGYNNPPIYSQRRELNERRELNDRRDLDQRRDNQRFGDRKEDNRMQYNQQQNNNGRQWNGGNNNGNNERMNDSRQPNQQQNNNGRQWNSGNSNGNFNNGSTTPRRDMSQGQNQGQQDQRFGQRRNDQQAGQNSGQGDNRNRDGNAQRRRF